MQNKEKEKNDSYFFLSKTFVDLGFKVLLIDADMRRPNVHKFFEIDNILGLSNLITDPEINLEDTMKSKAPNLDIITSGIKPPDPIFFLASNRMKIIHEKIIEVEL